MSLPPWPKAWIVAVFATVAVPPAMAMLPALMRIVPAGSRAKVIVFVRLSPVAVNCPAPGMNVAEIVMVVFLSKFWPWRMRFRVTDVVSRSRHKMW